MHRDDPGHVQQALPSTDIQDPSVKAQQEVHASRKMPAARAAQSPAKANEAAGAASSPSRRTSSSTLQSLCASMSLWDHTDLHTPIKPWNFEEFFEQMQPPDTEPKHAADPAWLESLDSIPAMEPYSTLSEEHGSRPEPQQLEGSASEPSADFADARNVCSVSSAGATALRYPDVNSTTVGISAAALGAAGIPDRHWAMDICDRFYVQYKVIPAAQTALQATAWSHTTGEIVRPAARRRDHAAIVSRTISKAKDWEARLVNGFSIVRQMMPARERWAVALLHHAADPKHMTESARMALSLEWLGKTPSDLAGAVWEKLHANLKSQMPWEQRALLKRQLTETQEDLSTIKDGKSSCA